ncbi:MAG: ankyrin repeat domain-containing protein [Vicinamibacterales bacterium]
MRRNRLTAQCLGALGALALYLSTAVVVAGGVRSTVADAARQGDRETVRALLKQGEDVNAAQGDGMTALHWAAMNGDVELTGMLISAGARVQATTRLGGYTPLYLAARAAQMRVVAALLAAGADVNAATSTGATPLMAAAAAGDARTVTMLIENRAEVNAHDLAKEETPLMYAAAYNRVDAIKVLLRAGADPKLTTKVIDLVALTTPEEQNSQRGKPSAGGGRAGAPAPPPVVRVAGVDRPYRYNELIGTLGGLTALHFAARQGYLESVKALIDSGADVNQVNPGDNGTPLLIAIVNGHFDLAMYFLEKGAAVSHASANGVTPLYAALNMQWHNKSQYPQPKAYQQQQTGYLELMTALLERGADPNVRLKKKVWHSGFNSDYSGVDEVGATPFWRAAYASDVDAMRLLVKYGADPHIPTMRPAGRPIAGDQARDVQDVSGKAPVPVGGPGVPPLLAASGVGYGEGFAANNHRYAPTGFLPAIKYLVEEVGADVNAVDHEGNSAIHLAASRGDTESILYLVSKGASVLGVNREGNTTADMANGPVQRIQPYPETLAVLVKLGAKNNNRCVTC